MLPALISSIRNNDLGSPNKHRPSDSSRLDATIILPWSNALRSLPSIKTIFDTSEDVIKVVKKLSRASPLRHLKFTVVNQTSGATKTIESIALSMRSQRYSYHLGRFMIPAKHGHRLGMHLRCLAESAASPPSNLTSAQHLWLLRGALSLLAADVNKSSNSGSESLVSLPSPHIYRQENGQLTCRVPLWGHGKATETSRAGQDLWDAHWELDVATILRCRPVQPLYTAYVKWTQLDDQQSADTQLNDKDLLHVHNVAKQAALIGGCWIGWPEQCIAAASEACTASRTVSLRNSPLCNFQKVFERGVVLLEPGAWLRNRAEVKFSDIRLNGPTTEEIFWVIDAILQGLNHGLSIHDAWLEGAAMSVTLREMYLEGRGIWPVTSCDHPVYANALHVCPGCWVLRVCSDFVESPNHPNPICKKCDSNGPQLNLTMPLDLTPYLRWRATVTFRNESKTHKLGWNQAEIKAKVDTLMVNLQPFFVDDTRDTIRDAFIDMDLKQDIRPVHLTEDGMRRHPLTPSIDAFTAVYPGADGRTAYHHEANIVPTSDAINHLMGVYEKPLLRAFSAMVLATEDTPSDRRLYERALQFWRDCHKNSYEMGSFLSRLLSHRINKPVPANMPAIMEALRTGKPLLPRTTSLSTVYRVTIEGQKVYLPAGWKFPDYSYIMDSIHSAAREHGLDSPELRVLWLRNGTFCPFALDCVLPEDYNDGTIWNIFYVRFDRMRKDCDWREVGNPHRERAEIGELMIAVAHLWFRNIKRDLQLGIPVDRCGRDELGLIPHATIRSLLSASVGHRHHAKPMTLGISNWDPAGGTACSFDYDKCNICWETCACNWIKFCWNEKYYPLIFNLLPNVRKEPLPGIDPKFHLVELPDQPLQTEFLPCLVPVEMTEDDAEEYSVPTDTEPASVTVHEDKPSKVERSKLGKHIELLEDVNVENPGFVTGYVDLRDYALDERDQQRIIADIEAAPVAQSLDVQAFEALTEDAIARIDPESPGRSGFSLVLDLLRKYYGSDRSATFADLANRLLQHIGMHQAFDVAISSRDELMDTITSAMSSAEGAETTIPLTPRRSKGHPAPEAELPSRIPKDVGSAKRVVVKDEAYSGSPTKSGRKKTLLSSPRAVSRLGMHGFAQPASPRIPSLAPRLLFPPASHAPGGQNSPRQYSHEGNDEDESRRGQQQQQGDEPTDNRDPV
ncbi:hypothetical protein PV08_11098 [Exophiala spinifera]|uniref:Uncharacterized protein n=1 Tax=Exophiala spinifera TaxID=91928 RepID=A0A0D1ZAU7_9EURO|nr:uncharacterized protein PV08_11098 [Exophiala spinifera]KIW10137.1 hypothetical protein PV08_11098 [Exophiala spinifera]